MISEEILKEIFRGLKEKYGDTGHWSKEELLRRMSMGSIKTVRLTDCLKTSWTTPVVQDLAGVFQQEYTKPNTLLRIDRIWYQYRGNRIFPLEIVDLDVAALEGRIGKPWSDNAAAPTNYYLRSKFIGLYPRPVAIDTWGIEGIRRPDDLILADIATQIPFNGRPEMYDFHDILVSYTLWKCLAEDQNDFFKEYKANFYNSIDDIKRQLKNNIPDRMETFELISPRRGRRIGPLPSIGS